MPDAVVAKLGHAELAAVEHVDGFGDGFFYPGLVEQFFVFPGLFYCFFHLINNIVPVFSISLSGCTRVR